MRTYRLTIESRDLSQVQLEGTSSGFAAFTVINARRGSTKPLFIPAGNRSYIVEQFGPPRASNTDVQEVIDFNVNNDIWVSAPPGVETSVNSKLGALFVTKTGIYNGYVDPADIEATGTAREAVFTTSKKDSTASIGLLTAESGGAESSKYATFVKEGSAASPLKLSASSEFTMQLETETDAVELTALGSNFTWSDRSSLEVTSQIPADSDSAQETSWEAAIVQLEGGPIGAYLDANPTQFRFLRVGSELVGFAYLYEDAISGNLVMQGRIYVAKNDGSTAVATFTDLPLSGDAYTELLAYASIDSSQVVKWTANISAVAMFAQKFPTATKTEISFNYPPRKDASDNEIQVSVIDWPAKNISIAPRTYTTSFDPTKKDTYNVNIGIDDVITNDRVIVASILDTAEPVMLDEIVPLSALTSSLTFEISGVRAIDYMDINDEAGVTAIVGSMNLGWEEAKNSEYDGLQIFFEPYGHDALNSTMLDIRTTHKFSRVVQPVLKGTTQANVEGVPARRGDYAYHHGLAYPWNEVLTRDPDTKTSWWRVPVGEYCSMLMRIMRIRNGAAAPMFVNDGSNLGGQIAVQHEEIRVKRIDTPLQREIDDAGFNTLVKDPNLGLMYINQRTGQNPDTINDASWLSHDMSFDLYKYAVQTTIMFPQLGKPINGQYIGLRARQVQALGASFADAFADVQHEVARLNTDESASQRKFNLATSVKVTPFSEFVDFMFYNVAQTSEVSDPFENLE